MQADADKGDQRASDWLKLGIDRSTVKQPTMTFSYGSTRDGMSDQIIDYSKDHHSEVVSKAMALVLGRKDP